MQGGSSGRRLAPGLGAAPAQQPSPTCTLDRRPFRPSSRCSQVGGGGAARLAQRRAALAAPLLPLPGGPHQKSNLRENHQDWRHHAHQLAGPEEPPHRLPVRPFLSSFLSLFLSFFLSCQCVSAGRSAGSARRGAASCAAPRCGVHRRRPAPLTRFAGSQLTRIVRGRVRSPPHPTRVVQARRAGGVRQEVPGAADVPGVLDRPR
jgi:hypothetical protein